ncbi:hypothetical protein BN3589_01490 [Clostridium sp. C105KSO14]|uniref:Uncharacterized protein n=1 Tax=Enterocloster clostridioformis TaxID=1531 RepID=A0A174R5L1_9FIRM|nr:Uncharacterised protein [Enterocloster clostridioformis]CUX71854.1 hypothetical protein BN3589_01490 [Clostridium sp. C105KSO14]SQB15831.1 Uncharacterised protein [Enterocloster clostridioformis]
MNKKFFALPQERQEQIINAAYEMRHMKCFPGTAIKIRPCPGLRMPAAYPNPCCFIIS